MQNTIKLKMAKFPKAIGELTHSNQFLKLSVFFSYGLCVLMMGSLYFTLSKAPVVLTLATDASILEPASLPKAEDEIIKAVRAYVDLRYKWEPQTVTWPA